MFSPTYYSHSKLTQATTWQPSQPVCEGCHVVAKLIGFFQALYSNPLPLDKTLAGVGRRSNPFCTSSRAACLAFIYR